MAVPAIGSEMQYYISQLLMLVSCLRAAVANPPLALKTSSRRLDPGLLESSDETVNRGPMIRTRGYCDENGYNHVPNVLSHRRLVFRPHFTNEPIIFFCMTEA